MFCLCLFCPVVHRVVRVERCVDKREYLKSESCCHWGAGRYSKCTQNNFVYGELGRYPLQIIKYVRIIKYWLNIVTCKKLLYIGALYYDTLNGIDNHGGDSWIKSVRSLLCNHGFGEVWYNHGLEDPDLFLKLFRGRCFDIFKQNWQEQLKESPRARFYRAIKTNHCFSSCLKKN